MNILIRQARIIAPGSAHHDKVSDIYVEGGYITAIRKNLQPKGSFKLVEGESICVSPGWIDLQSACWDPGFEHKEDLDSLAECAAAGGFTGVCVHSCSNPPLHTKSQIEYVKGRTENKVTDVLPMGTVTAEAKGRDIAELFDMMQSGAVGFSDYKHPIESAGTMLRALQYAAGIGTFIVAHCNDTGISRGGHVNESEAAASLGLKTIPPLAEELMLARNLAILEYAGGRLHVPVVSTRGSVELVKKAKGAGLNVTCGVSAAHLCFDDTVLAGFDTNYKLDPPLRTKRDVQALRNAVDTGVIDVIVSDHQAQDTESKELEFDLAENGIISLQTAFSCALEGLKEKSLDTIVRAFAVNPRKILGMRAVTVAEEERANITVFSPAGTTTLTARNNRSRSSNSPFLDKPLRGKVIGVVNGSKSYFN